MSLRIKLFGTLSVANEDDTPSELMKWRKGCALLAYLIVARTPQPREMLADLLWEASSTAQSLRNLRTLLARIRKWIPELEVTRKQVRYPTETAVFVDYHALIAGLENGDLANIASVLPLYQGEFLDGFYLENAPRFNEWLFLTREKLWQRVTEAFRQLCTIYQEQSDWIKGIALAQRWLALDDLDEEALSYLLQLLAGSGQFDIALQQYEVSRHRLWNELGVEPMESTRQLVAQIAELKETYGGGFIWHEVVGSPRQPPPPETLPEPGHLPSNAYVPYHRNKDFVGRQGMLLQIGKAFLCEDENKRQRAVAVTGMGGLGKTQLAVEFCYRYGRYFPGGVFWLSFAEPENIAAEVALIGSERGMSLFQDAEQLTLNEKVDQVQEAWQQPIPRLLIFDSCEDESYLAQWLPTTGSCCVLTTSTRTNWSQSPQVKPYSLSVLTPKESTRLLIQVAPTLPEEDTQEIAEWLGHLPLALHLAGSFLGRYRQISPAQYLQQLRDQGLLHHPSLQGRGIDHSPTGHELHVARTFALSLAQLEPQDEVDRMAQQLLRHAACFAPNELIPRQVLRATVLPEETNDQEAELLAEDGLSRLIALGFLVSSDEQSLMIHRLLAAYTNDVFDDTLPAETAVAQTVCQIIYAKSEAIGTMFSVPVATTHLYHLLQSALPRGGATAADLALRLGQHLHHVADYKGAREYLEKALHIYEQTHGVSHATTTQCLQSLGVAHFRAGDYWEGRAFIERALTNHEKSSGSDIKTATTLSNLGYIVLFQGDCEAARHYLENALALLEKSPEQHQSRIATVLNNLGVTYLSMGDTKTAKPYLEDALTLRETALAPDHPHTAVSYQNVGLLHLRLQAYDKARNFLERALTTRKKSLGYNHPHTARSFNALAELHLVLGNLETAQSYLEQTLAIQDAVFVPEHPEKALTYKLFGELYLALGHAEAARPYFEQAQTILSQFAVPTHPDTLHVQQRLNQ